MKPTRDEKTVAIVAAVLAPLPLLLVIVAGVLAALAGYAMDLPFQQRDALVSAVLVVASVIALARALSFLHRREGQPPRVG